jgi:ADP-ribosylation factor-like protein 3
MPTRGFWIRSLALANRTELSVWDVGGRRDVRGYWRAYYSRVQTIIFVIDAGDRRRMQEASDVLMQLLDEEALVGMPLLVLANKQDLAGALPAGEIEACMHLGSILDRHWHCVGCSALRGSGLAAGLKWLSELHQQRERPRAGVSRSGKRRGRERAPSASAEGDD